MLKLVKDLALFILGLVETLLVFRFILKLLGANPQSDLVSWIYQTTDPLLQPFLFAFPTPTVRNGAVLEFTTLFAIFVYAFIAYLIQEALDMFEARSHK